MTRIVTGLVRVAWTATLAAGAIGVIRQRRQAAAVAAGALVSDGPDGARPPHRTPGPVGSLLAGWLPTPPRTLTGQLATTLWSAPLTLVGLGVAGISGASLQWDPTRRCLLATGVRGPSRAALRFVGAGANAIGQVVLCRTDDPSATLLDHEAVHVRQAERLGPLLIPVYLWLNAIHGYRDHPLERAARLGARRTSPWSEARADQDGQVIPQDVPPTEA